MAMAQKRYAMKMGFAPHYYPSYFEVDASAWVLPEAALKLPYDHPQKWRTPGASYVSFDADLNPSHLNVKAGTQGQITIWVRGFYYLRKFDPSLASGADGKKVEGHVIADGTWNYRCTKEGELSLDNYAPTHSAKAPGHFWLTVSDPAEAKEKPSAGFPYVMLRSWAHYKDSKPASGLEIPWVGNLGGGPDSPEVDLELQPLIARLNIVDKYVPPPPPSPKQPIAPLSVVIPFGKEGQTSLDSQARKIAANWAQTLFKTHPELEVPMMKGEIPVYFFGYATKTPPRGERDEQKADDFNIEIGNERARSAMKYLIPSPLGSGAKANYKSFGRRDAEWAKVFDEKLKKAVEVVGKPRDIDRVVMVWVDPDEAKAVLNRPAAARPAPPTRLPDAPAPARK